MKRRHADMNESTFTSHFSDPENFELIKPDFLKLNFTESSSQPFPHFDQQMIGFSYVLDFVQGHPSNHALFVQLDQLNKKQNMKF